MKIGMILLLLMVLATSYLIGRAIRNSIKAKQRQRLELARWLARWEPFTDPEENEIQVGVRKVARSGKWCEVVETQVMTRVPITLPQDERDLEVQIARTDAESYANTLNS